MAEISPELVVSLVTAVIAFLTLWFTSLRGPEISLLSDPKVDFAVETAPLFRVPEGVPAGPNEYRRVLRQ